MDFNYEYFLFQILQKRVIDVGSEWRTFSNHNQKPGADPSRVGGPENPLLNGSDLTTIIMGGGRRDGDGDQFPFPKYHSSSSIPSAERALVNGFQEISGMADRMNLPRSIVDRANSFLKVGFQL